MATWNGKTMMYYFERRNRKKVVFVNNEEQFKKAEAEGHIPIPPDFTYLKVDCKEREDFVMWLPENLYVALGNHGIILGTTENGLIYLINRYKMKEQYN